MGSGVDGCCRKRRRRQGLRKEFELVALDGSLPSPGAIENDDGWMQIAPGAHIGSGISRHGPGHFSGMSAFDAANQVPGLPVVAGFGTPADQAAEISPDEPVAKSGVRSVRRWETRVGAWIARRCSQVQGDIGAGPASMRSAIGRLVETSGGAP